MISLFWKAVGINIRQFMTDIKGLFANPEETLKEISERNKWGIPILLLIITSYIGLPGTFIILKKETFQALTVPLFGVPFLFGVLLVIIKVLKKAGNPLTFLKLTGYLGIPYIITLALTSIPAVIIILVTHQHTITVSFKNPLSIGLFTILTILLAITTIITIRLLIMIIRVSFPSVSKKGAFLYFLFTVVLLNCILNIFIKPEHIKYIKGETTPVLTWTHTFIQTK